MKILTTIFPIANVLAELDSALPMLARVSASSAEVYAGILDWRTSPFSTDYLPSKVLK